MIHIPSEPKPDANNDSNVDEFYKQLQEHDNGTCALFLLKTFCKILYIIPTITTDLVIHADRQFLTSRFNQALNQEETQQQATIREMIKEECNRINDVNTNKFKNLNVNPNKKKGNTAKNFKAGNKNQFLKAKTGTSNTKKPGLKNLTTYLSKEK